MLTPSMVAPLRILQEITLVRFWITIRIIPRSFTGPKRLEPLIFKTGKDHRENKFYCQLNHNCQRRFQIKQVDFNSITIYIIKFNDPNLINYEFDHINLHMISENLVYFNKLSYHKCILQTLISLQT